MSVEFVYAVPHLPTHWGDVDGPVRPGPSQRTALGHPQVQHIQGHQSPDKTKIGNFKNLNYSLFKKNYNSYY